MDALPFINEMLSEQTLESFLLDNVPDDVKSLNLIRDELIKVQIFMATANFREHPEDEKQALIEGCRLTARKVGNFMREIVRRPSREQRSSSQTNNLVDDWKETVNLIIGIVVSCNYIKKNETEGEVDNKVMEAVKNAFHVIKRLESSLPGTGDNSKCTTPSENSRELLLVKTFPALCDLEEAEMLNFLLDLSKELDNLPQQICKACEGHSLALLLIGGVLSLKPSTYDTWKKVKDDLCKRKEADNRATNNSMSHILAYCYDDLPHFLKPCFLHLACYPIDYPIPATSLTEIWIAEGFVKPEKGETLEETANNYLQQLVQRSLVSILKRSFSGTIKYCGLHRSIHEFAIKQSHNDGFLVANPDKDKMESLFRLAVHSNNNNQYEEVENNHIHSFLAFGFDRNVLSSAVFLRVLELRKSKIPEIALSEMIYLRYLGLRDSVISERPLDIGYMKNLQTLDVRDTNIEILPESLWNIKTLRHVYVKPSPKFKGPPSTAEIDDLQTLKTVVVHESWKENFPQFLSSLRKLALSNKDNLNGNSNPYWKSISKLLSHMVNLLSMEIIGDTLPSEFADTRAFPNLETVKSIKLEGQWSCRKLFIDNIKFPPNLTKLTLTNSGLKEDPMPRLEKLQALKFLCLYDGAYIGNKMVCSADGFPQLQSLELKKLMNLENFVCFANRFPHLQSLELKKLPNLVDLELHQTAMSQPSKLCVVQCLKLKEPRNLEHVTIEYKDN